VKNYLVFAAIALLVPVALVTAACGDDDDSTAATSTPAASGTKAGAGPTTSGAKRTEVDELHVTAKDFSFSADLTSVHPGAPGTDVTFTNSGGTTHTLTFYSDSDYKNKVADSGRIAAGQIGGFPFIPPDGAKKLYYRCEIHPTQMKGEIAVQ
jgi:plastocyanin